MAKELKEWRPDAQIDLMFPDAPSRSILLPRPAKFRLVAKYTQRTMSSEDAQRVFVRLRHQNGLELELHARNDTVAFPKGNLRLTILMNEPATPFYHAIISPRSSNRPSPTKVVARRRKKAPSRPRSARKKGGKRKA